VPRFNMQVKLFALDERAKGEGWKAIGQGIRGKFGIEPPTVRAMQKWEKKLDRLAISHQLMREARGQMPNIEADAQVRFAQELIPVLWQAKDAGKDMEISGWKWFLKLVEDQLGSDKFEHLITEYMAEREIS